MSKAGSLFALIAIALMYLPDPSRADDARALYERGILPGQTRNQQPCAGCHGRDGGGRKEGGVTAPAINRDALRRRGPYAAADMLVLLKEGRAPDSRAIDRIMPRYLIDPLLAEELIAYLQDIRARDATGVGPDRIRIGVAASGPQDPLPERVRRAIARWSEGRLLHGRRIDIVTLEPEAVREELETFFAVIGLTARDRTLAEKLGERGILNLFPRHALAGDEDPSLVRGLSADLTSIGRALAAAAAQCDAVRFEGSLTSAASEVIRAAAARALDAQKRPASAAGKASACRILIGPQPSSMTAAGDRIIAPLDLAAPLMPALVRAATPMTLIDTRPVQPNQGGVGARTDDGERFAQVAALVLGESLARAGRRLTRSRLMEAMDTLSVAPPGWPALDYRTHRLTGTAMTAEITVGGAR